MFFVFLLMAHMRFIIESKKSVTYDCLFWCWNQNIPEQGLSMAADSWAPFFARLVASAPLTVQTKLVFVFHKDIFQ